MVVKRIIYHRDSEKFHWETHYESDKLIDIPYLAGKMHVLFEGFTPKENDRCIHHSLFNESSLARIELPLGRNEVYYLELRKGTELSEIFTEPQSLSVEIYVGAHYDHYLYSFYNNTDNPNIIISAKLTDINLTQFHELKNNLADISLRRNIVDKMKGEKNKIDASISKNKFLMEKNVWEIKFNGNDIKLENNSLKGLHYIHLLLTYPNEYISPDEFLQSFERQKVDQAKGLYHKPIIPYIDSNKQSTIEGRAILFTDIQSINDYKEKIETLKNILANFEDDGFSKESAKYKTVKNELDILKKHLIRNTNISGKPRNINLELKKKYDAITKSIVKVRKSLIKEHPELEKHLKNSIKPSNYKLSYAPEKEVSWILE